ncbi:MAG: flagellar biosynthetic protein FliR [Pseudooceanicola sp.]
MNLSALATGEFLAAALVFARIGGIVMFVPAFGEAFIPMRHRLAAALVLALAINAAVGPGPVRFDSVSAMIMAFGIEVTIGVWIGLAARILMTALQFAGYQVGMISGLSNAFAPSIGSFEGATLISTGLMLGAVAVIFATDLHHHIIGAMAMSYDVFPIGLVMPGDLSQQMVRAVSQSFYLGLSIAGPFYVMGMLVNLGLGLTNRMMPNLPVFFVAAPVLIFTGLLVLVIAVPHMLSEFADRFGAWLGLLTF